MRKIDIAERKFQILAAIIDDYIMTAAPVGSRTISKKYVGLSSATIRNEMSDLEEMGYLDQPHTSAGRIPSQKAYRLYVDQLMQVQTLSPDEADRIRGYFTQRMDQVEDVIKAASLVLSDVTQYTSIVLPKKKNSLRMRSIQLVPISDHAALVVAVTDAGIVKDVFIPIPQGMSPDDLFGISKMLTAQLEGKTLEEIRPLVLSMQGSMKRDRDFFLAILDALEGKASSDDSVMVGGATNILNFPEYASVDKAKGFLSVLETKEKLHQLLQDTGEMELTIRIGKETGLSETQDCSLVSASYRVGEEPLGSIGIIGPTRMRYAKVISVLKFMGKSISEILSGL